jgi:hypothetical protein
LGFTARERLYIDQVSDQFTVARFVRPKPGFALRASSVWPEAQSSVSGESRGKLDPNPLIQLRQMIRTAGSDYRRVRTAALDHGSILRGVLERPHSGGNFARLI